MEYTPSPKDPRGEYSEKPAEGAKGPRSPDFDYILPGYYYTQSLDEALHYIAACIREYKTITISAHIGAYFINYDAPNEPLFHCHSKAKVFIFDEDQTVPLDEIDIFAEAESIEGFRKSGLSQYSEPYYYFKVYGCNLGTITPPKPKNETVKDIIIQSKLPSSMGGKQRKLAYNKWSDRIDMPNYELTPATLHEWNSKIQENIRVFNARGYCIYHRKYNPGEWINIYWNSVTRQFIRIKSLHSFFNVKKDCCDECHVVHRGQCPKIMINHKAKNDHIPVNKKPFCAISNVIYADFECYLKDNIYYPSGLTYIHLEEGELINTEDIVSDNVASVFMDKLEVIADKIFRPKTDMKPDARCERCGSDTISPFYICNPNTGVDEAYCPWHIPEYFIIPVVFHNFKGFDSHLLLTEIVKRGYKTHLSAKSIEKIDVLYVRDKYIRIKFMDSFNFLSASLDALGKNVTHKKFMLEDDMKGPFPYEWFDSLDKLDDEQLPSPENWVNKVTGEVGDYKRAQEIWDEIGAETFLDFHNYYMNLDVRILTDVCEEFRNTVWENHKVDPFYFQGAPGLTWYLGTQEMERHFHIIPDDQIYLDIQKNIRGGVCQVTQRYATNELGKIVYLDVNSLYSWCMTQDLPGKFLGKFEDNHFDLNDDDYIYLISCDLDYPKELHDTHWEYPLAPEKYIITKGQPKLLCTLYNKKNYLVASYTLKLYLQLGMQLKAVHYYYKFEAIRPLMEYVTKNIEIRKANLHNKPLADLCKLMNNSIYGKTCENVLKYKKYLIGNQEDLIDSADFIKIINPNEDSLPNEKHFLISKSTTECTLNKPIQLGFCILEWAKWKMYQFWYYLKAIYGDQCKLLYTDTDSFMIQFNKEIPDPWESFRQIIPDFIDFEKTKTIGLFSDEAESKEIEEFVGIRAKTYSYRTTKNVEVNKNKGVARGALKLDTKEAINFEDYCKALFDKSEIRVQQRLIRSKRQVIGVKDETKLAIHLGDDKRFGCADPIFTLPWGYQGERYDGPLDVEYDPYERVIDPSSTN